MQLDWEKMFLVLLILMIFPSVICEFPWLICNKTSNYTERSTYSVNLDSVLNDLSSNAPQNSGFNTSSRGQSPNKVYALLQCFANISAAKCSYCSRNASNIAQRNCTNDIGGSVWMDECFLRYDNFNFTSTLSTRFQLLVNPNPVSSNVQDFTSTTSSLLLNLSQEAYIPTNKPFAVGSANYSTSGMVYGLVQCWRDLSIKDCRTCLFKAWGELEPGFSSNQGARALSRSCTVRYETNSFFYFGEPSPSPPPSTEAEVSPPHPTTPTPSSLPVAHGPAKGTSQAKSKKSSKTRPLILGLVGGMVLVLLICLIAMRKRVKSTIFGGAVSLPTHNEDRHGFSSEFGLLKQEQRFLFSFEELAEATENFNENKKLGEGGFGSVYKGSTRDGNEIAVKKLSAKSTQGKNEFMNEVKLVANVQHRNLVKLLGCCAEGDEKLLVYEYFPNKSLDTFLFDPKKCRLLNWQKRYNIIIGIARGLLYLHEDSQMRIIHRDIKANNILLDDKLNAKIADFGLAKLFPEDETQIQTRVAGTYGYMAPEYAMQGQLSVKTDVYSFGVLLLEIVSGKKNTDIHVPQGMQTLVEWAWRLYKGGNILEMVDSAVSEESSREQALRCIHVGLVCVQADPTLRPPISNIIMLISSSSLTLPIPTAPAFVTRRNNLAVKSRSKSSSWSDQYENSTASQAFGTSTSSASGIPSVNETSVTEMNAR